MEVTPRTQAVVPQMHAACGPPGNRSTAWRSCCWLCQVVTNTSGRERQPQKCVRAGGWGEGGEGREPAVSPDSAHNKVLFRVPLPLSIFFPSPHEAHECGRSFHIQRESWLAKVSKPNRKGIHSRKCVSPRPHDSCSS